MISESDGSLRTRDVADRRLSIIDVSSADDSLLLDPLSGNFLNNQHSENEQHGDLWYTPNSKKFEDAASKIEQWEQEPQTSETRKTKKSSKCNLRKSLAWDSAFFTSAGVLDPEELSSIIEGVEKEALPGIEEDVYKSCESISTLESDSLTLESVDVEGDLFEDVRASIQKSSNKSNLASANTKVPSPSGLSPGFQTPSRKVGMVSRNKMKVPPAPKNPSAGVRGIGKMTNKNSPIFTPLPQLVATRRESSISKQSKIPGKPSASSIISSKRVSLGDLHVKSKKDKAKQITVDRISSVSKASVAGGSRGTGPKPTLSSKLTSGMSVSTKTKSATSTSSGSNLSDNIGKLKRKVNAGTSKPPSSCPAVRTPSRFTSRNNTESGNSSLSGLMSATQLSSSISPASSVSDWSSESSSSTSMPKHVCNSSRSSLESSSSSKVLSDTNAEQGINYQIEGREAQHTSFISQSVRTVVPPAPVKPSGLRLPSPKIGFFDGVKSSVRTPRGGMQPQSVVPHGLPKHGARTPGEVQNKAKLGKLQPARSITSIENKKPDNQQNSHLNHFHESLEVAIKTSSALQNVKSSSDMPIGTVENIEHTSPSHQLERTHYDLHPLRDVDDQENVHYDNQVDCLSKQVGLMDINFKTYEKINGDSLSSFQTSHKELFDCPNNEELLKGSSTPSLSVSPTSFDTATSVRRPFAAKDSFCNMDCSFFTDSTVSEVKPTNLPVPESITKENS